MLVIISGLISAGLVINEAFIEWNAHKVLTTLDSVAAPISEIQVWSMLKLFLYLNIMQIANVLGFLVSNSDNMPR